MSRSKAKPKTIKRSAGAPRKRRSSARTQTSAKGTKQAQLIAMLRRPEGATIPQLTVALGWQPHSVRGAMATIKKKLGISISSEKPADGPRVYRSA